MINKKKYFLLIIFNISLLYYFASIIDLKDSVQQKRQMRLESYKNQAKIPLQFAVEDIREWNLESTLKMHTALKEWLTFKKGYVSEDLQGKYLEIEDRSAQFLSQVQLLNPYQTALESYEERLGDLRERVTRGKWYSLLQKIEKLSSEPDPEELPQTKEELQHILDYVLTSNLSQVHKESVLDLTAEVEKSLIELNFSYETYKGYSTFVANIKNLDRQGQDKLVFELEKNPYESPILFVGGWMLFMLINGWLILASFKPVIMRSPASSLKMAGVSLTKRLAELYSETENPFIKIKWEEGETLFSSKINDLLVLSLYDVQKEIGSKGDLSLSHKGSGPCLEVNFNTREKTQTKDISSILLKTHKDLSGFSGAVEWEAEFDEEAILKSINISYQLPSLELSNASV